MIHVLARNAARDKESAVSVIIQEDDVDKQKQCYKNYISAGNIHVMS